MPNCLAYLLASCYATSQLIIRLGLANELPVAFSCSSGLTEKFLSCMWCTNLLLSCDVPVYVLMTWLIRRCGTAEVVIVAMSWSSLPLLNVLYFLLLLHLPCVPYLVYRCYRLHR